MHFENAELGCAFDLPEPFTLADYEAWMRGRDAAEKAGAVSIFSVNWAGAARVVRNWQCAALPDPQASHDQISGEQLRVVAWAGLVVYHHVTGLFQVPKVRLNGLHSPL